MLKLHAPSPCADSHRGMAALLRALPQSASLRRVHLTGAHAISGDEKSSRALCESLPLLGDLELHLGDTITSDHSLASTSALSNRRPISMLFEEGTPSFMASVTTWEGGVTAPQPSVRSERCVKVPTLPEISQTVKI